MKLKWFFTTKVQANILKSMEHDGETMGSSDLVGYFVLI